MHSPGINGEGELRGQLANPGSPGKMAVKMECVCVFLIFDFQKCCDLEIRVRGHSKSLKVVPFDRLCMVSY